MSRHLLAAALVIAAGGLAACGGSSAPASATRATATPATPGPNVSTTAPGLTFAGAFSGRMQQATTTCGLHQPAKFGPAIAYLEVTGTVGGKAFDVRVFDPAGAADPKSSAYVLVSESGYYWIDESSNSIESYDASGATLDAAARPSVGAKFGNNPYSSLTITGSALC